MSHIVKKHLSMHIRRTTVGCGVQGNDCLALAVKGREGAWRIAWGLYGRRGDKEFARELRGRVWRRPLWAPPWDSSAEQEAVVCQVDLDLSQRKQAVPVSVRVARAALRTQVMGRFSFAAEPAVLRGLEMVGPEGARHLIGAVARVGMMDREYSVWRKEFSIIHPHVGSSAAALANAYLALYPADRRRAAPDRMLALEGRETTHAVLMRDWRLVDAIQYEMPEGQCLDTTLMDQWLRYFQTQYRLADLPTPCVIRSREKHSLEESVEVWSPFDGKPPIVIDPAVLTLIREHADLAPLAFGMALQGG